MRRYLPGVSTAVSASEEIALLATARQQRSVILANTKRQGNRNFHRSGKLTAYRCEMKKKLDTDDEGMISDYESDPEMSE